MPIPDDVLLVHGDCFDVMPKIPAGSVDMVFADLPYAHETTAGRIRHCTNNAWDAPVDISLLWRDLLAASKRTAPFVFTAIQPFTTTLICSKKELFRYDVVWRKGQSTGFFNAKKRPLRSHESILLFAQTQTCYNPQMFHAGRPRHSSKCVGQSGGTNYRATKRTEVRISNDRYPTSVIDISRRENKLHPTQKPVALLEWLIKTYTNPGDLVLDPCSGSGTTAIAALNTGRRAICVEKNATYHAAAVKRLAEARRAPSQPALPLAARNT